MDDGIDTLVVSWSTTKSVEVLEQLTQRLRFHEKRGHFQLYASKVEGKYLCRLQCSLPKLVSGANCPPTSLEDIEQAFEILEGEFKAAFPELHHVRIAECRMQRVDFAFDTQIPCTEPLLRVLFGSYADWRAEPGYIFHGPASPTLYTVDCRSGRRRMNYRAICLYGKMRTSGASRTMRIETRLYGQSLRYYCKKRTLLKDLPCQVYSLRSRAWDYVCRRFELVPRCDETARVGIAFQEFMQGPGWLLAEVTVQSVIGLLEKIGFSRASIRSDLRRYGMGHGDPTTPGLREFVDVLEEGKRQFSRPY